jgi:hypothetical protein
MLDKLISKYMLNEKKIYENKYYLLATMTINVIAEK